jgi:vitamin B12 transporter
MNELYWPEDAWSGGNEDLEPESVSTLEAGAEGRVGDVAATVTAYRSDATDLIGWVPSAADGKYYPMNVGEADLRGVELEFRADLGPVKVQYAVSYATSEDVNSGFALPYRPEASQWFSVSAETGRLDSELRMRSSSDVYADVSEGGELDGYGLVDFTAMLDLPWAGTALRFEGLNITDERYRTRQYYDMPGSEWRVSLLLGWEDDA